MLGVIRVLKYYTILDPISIVCAAPWYTDDISWTGYFKGESEGKRKAENLETNSTSKSIKYCASWCFVHQFCW